MRVAVVGSRHYRYLGQVGDFVRTLPPNTVLVSGGAIGVDRAAETIAKIRGLPTIILPARWSMFGKVAGYIRNGEIIANADVVVAFWDLESKGTKDTIKQAIKAHIPVYVYTSEDVLSS